MHIGIGLMIDRINTSNIGIPLSVIQSLYNGGKTGALYIVSQLSSVFQDRSATPSTPASVNGPVGTILDLSGNNNHWIAGSDAKRPILRQSGSLFFLQSDGVSQSMVSTTTWAQGVSSSWVVGIQKQNSGDSIPRIIGSSASSTQFAWTTTDITFSVQNFTSGDGLVTTPLASDANAHTFTYLRNQPSNSAIIRNNGVQIASTTHSVTSITVNTNFASSGDGTANFSNYNFFGCILISGVLSGSDLSTAETYIGAQSGLVI
jgi:hypothetical protein